MWRFNSIVVLVFIWLGDGSRLNKSCLHDLGVLNHHCYRVSSQFLVKFISVFETPFLFRKIAPIVAALVQYFAQNGRKTTLFDMKMVIHLIRILLFYWYLICFKSEFGSWIIVLKEKSWSIRWSKIYINRTIGSKSQYFDHPQLGVLV